ncbi:family 20 glycosylhydrolase [Pseudoduganella sp. FT93W]|uniref:beta-N-acetylhexosaminidase n=2 Tax=Duganella fentianensis TaxID=2692177 RepID=A0A845I347_9BURK|nr:family 20 glycosylhydrolase [Duganella fentianensis]
MRHMNLELAWACLGNDASGFSARLQIRNAGPAALPAAGWTLYFNTCRPVDPARLSASVCLLHPGGDLFGFAPAAGFAGLLPGQTLEIEYWSAGWAISVTDAPLGFYLVLQDAQGGQQVRALGDAQIAPFLTPAQQQRGPEDRLPASTAATRYAAACGLPEAEALHGLTPAPQSWRSAAGRLTLGAATRILYQPALASEAELLRELLDAQWGLAPHCLPADGQPAGDAIVLRLAQAGDGIAHGEETYGLEVRPQGVLICGASGHGIAHGIQSLLQLLSSAVAGVIQLPLGVMRDAPRYAYRGLMLDVARHFIGKAAVLRIIDLMACYKLNTLHLHLSDDEGWRIAIAALPELTEVGARRGADAALCASFGSGPQAQDSAGSGYYSRADFIEILRHAQRRHISVLPEIDLPGHARAAILAMQARHQRLLAAGQVEAAEAYLLSDPEDCSTYLSVQLWRDNVMCVARPGCLRFIETVLRELQSIYAEAGTPLHTIHTGGDEVPDGAWLASPLCRQLMAQHGLATTAQLQEYFFDQLRALVQHLGLRLAGWEEMAVASAPDGTGRAVPNPRFLDAPMRSYVWLSAWGKGREDLGYRLANAGYPVVLCNGDRLYLDLACAKDPEEPGYYWAGFPGLREVLEFCPEDIYTDARCDLMGQALEPAALAGMVRLSEQGRANILGIQAQLWGENVRDGARLDYLLFPRLLAVAERAWCASPVWAGMNDMAARRAAQDAAWAEFSQRLGRHTLPRLDSLAVPPAYRLPVPGVVLQDGVLHANLELPGLTMRYTLDGSEPDAQAAVYTAPFAWVPSPQQEGAQVRIAAFSSNGRKGRSAVLDLPSSTG